MRLKTKPSPYQPTKTPPPVRVTVRKTDSRTPASAYDVSTSMASKVTAAPTKTKGQQ